MPAKPKKRAPAGGPAALVPIQFRLPAALVNAIDARITRLNLKRVLPLSRTDVVRLLFDRWLKEDDEKGETL